MNQRERNCCDWLTRYRLLVKTQTTKMQHKSLPAWQRAVRSDWCEKKVLWETSVLMVKVTPLTTVWAMMDGTLMVWHWSIVICWRRRQRVNIRSWNNVLQDLVVWSSWIKKWRSKCRLITISMSTWNSNGCRKNINRQSIWWGCGR